MKDEIIQETSGTFIIIISTQAFTAQSQTSGSPIM